LSSSIVQKYLECTRNTVAVLTNEEKNPNQPQSVGYLIYIWWEIYLIKDSTVTS